MQRYIIKSVNGFIMPFFITKKHQQPALTINMTPTLHKIKNTLMTHGNITKCHYG